MLTLLPYPSFKQSAKVLFNNELTDQLKTVDRILNVLHRVDADISGWNNSPGVLMWEGFESQLCTYGIYLADNIKTRDLTQSVLIDLNTVESSIIWHLECTGDIGSTDQPKWFGEEKLHLSHQSELIRINAEYRSVFPYVPTDVPIVWPESL